jgi:hypothetical protein
MNIAAIYCKSFFSFYFLFFNAIKDTGNGNSSLENNYKVDLFFLEGRSLSWCIENIFFLLFFRLKKEQADRPKLYDDILQSSAVQSLSAEITDGEAKMAKNVIEKIPAFEG